MRFWLVFLLLLCFCLQCFAQPAPSASNNAAQKKHIDSVNTVVYNTFLKSPDAARNMAEQMLLLSEKLKYQEGIARSYSNIGVIYWSQSYYPIALFYLNTALENTPKGNSYLYSEIYSNIGRVYAELGNYTLSLENLRKSKICAGSDKVHLGEVLAEESYMYVRMRNYAMAIDAAQKSLTLDKEVGEEMGAAIDYSRLGDIYGAQKDYTRALAYYDTSYRKSVVLKMNRLRAGLYLEYARINNDQHNYSTAMNYARKGIALYDSIGNMVGLSNTYKAMIVSLEATNDLKNALYYQRKYNQIEDSLNTVDKLRSTQLIQNYFALNEHLKQYALAEKRDEDNRQKIAFQHSFINILLVSLILVIAAAAVMLYFYEQKRKLSRKLQQQNQLIEAQAANLEMVNGLKDKMFAVIGHDLRTPIANLVNISSLFESKDLSDQEVQMLMKDISPVIRGTELTLSNLLDWAGSQVKGRTIHLAKVDLHEIGVVMEQTFYHLLMQKSISFTNEIGEGQIVNADENHVKVILRNLISNAIKFTEPGGHINLYTREKGDRLVVCVKDTGRGLTADEIDRLFYLTTHFSAYGTKGEKGTGLGLILCRELVELNGGKLTVTSKPGEGSKFCVDLPLVKQK
ncbi:MAG: tetratricopeptide repeat-containing sensor histidine kinase [Mucilaginibacter sp.]